MSAYFCMNLATLARCLLAVPMMSRMGSSWRRLMGNPSAIQQRPVSTRAALPASSAVSIASSCSIEQL